MKKERKFAMSNVRKLQQFLAILTCNTLMFNMVFAEDFGTRAVGIIKSGYRMLYNVVTPLAALLAVACIVVIMLSKNSRAVQEAWSWLKRVGIGWLAIMALPTIFSLIGNLVGLDSDSTNEITNTFNSLNQNSDI